MRRTLALLILSTPLFGQTADFSFFSSTKVLRIAAGTPSGACTNPNEVVIASANGRIYTCFGGSWQSGSPSGTGSVTSIAITAPTGFTVSGSPVTTSGTIALSFTSGQTANSFLATPNGTTGPLGIRTIVAGDVPHNLLSAFHTDTTPASPVAGDMIIANGGTPTWQRLAHGVAGNVLQYSLGGIFWGAIHLDGGITTVTGVLPSSSGGTGDANVQFAGPNTSVKTFTLPNASANILTDNAAVTVAQGGTNIASYTKGDLLCASGATTLIKLGIGADTQVLTADSGQTCGVKWATGGGGGGTANIPLQVTFGSNTILNIGSACAGGNPCIVRVGSSVFTFTSGATATVTSGSGTVYFYVDSSGVISAGIASAGNPAVTCSGCTTVTGITTFPNYSIPLATWTATSVVWAGTGTDQRSILSSGVVLSSGTGISITPSAGGATIAVTSGTTQTIASGTQALGTSLIASAACASTITISATGVLTTDNVLVDFNADPTSTTGYIPSTAGGLTIFKFPTADHTNIRVCNFTSSGITPGAVTVNWRAVR